MLGGVCLVDAWRCAEKHHIIVSHGDIHSLKYHGQRKRTRKKVPTNEDTTITSSVSLDPFWFHCFVPPEFWFHFFQIFLFRLKYLRSLLHTAISDFGTPSSENQNQTSPSARTNFLNNRSHAVEVSPAEHRVLPGSPLAVVVVGTFDCTVATHDVTGRSPSSLRERQP